MKALLRLMVEAGPLAVFFIGNAKFGIFPATAAFMAATVLAIVIAWARERRLPMLPLVSGVFVVVFGGLTLALQDDLFIKMKPTIVNSLFAAILLGGLAAGQPLLQKVMDGVIQMDRDGWMKLTLRWGLFFIALAVLNEVVWRQFTTDQWVSFKVFGIMPLTLVFALAQSPLILRHAPAEPAPVPAAEPQA